MGIVIRQATKRSVVAYIGAAIGMASQLWIYPLNYGVYGDFQFVLSMIVFFMPWASLGILGLNNRFYPYFKDEDRGNGFFSIQFVALIVSFLLFLFFVTSFEETFYFLISKIEFKVEAFRQYSGVIVSSLFFFILLTFFGNFSTNLKRVVVPYFMSIFSWKLILPLLILLLYNEVIVEQQLFSSIAYIYAGLSVIMFLYIYKLNKIKFSLRITDTFKKQFKSMVWFAGYGLISGYGSLLAYTIDKIMVRSYTTDYDTGVYASMVILSGFILYPYDSIQSISTPIISKHWKEKDIDKIRGLNNKATNVLSFIVPLAFVLAFINIKDIANFTSNKEAFLTGIDAFFFLGCAKMINGLFGLNLITLNYSRYYYMVFFTTLILGVSNVLLNYWLIPKYGMTGAAIASMIALVSSNLIVFAFNWIKFGIQPFDYKVLKVLLIIVLAAFVSIRVELSIPFVNMMIRTTLFLLLSFPLIYYLKLVPDVNVYVEKLLQRGGK